MALPELGANLAQMAERAVARNGEAPFLWAKRDGRYQPWSWARVGREAQLLARTLVAMGVEPGDRVSIVAENRPEWCVADLAVMAAGGITVPSYTTYTTGDYAYVLGHSEARLVIYSGASVAKRLLPAVAATPSVEAVLAIDPAGEEEAPVPSTTYAQALARGEREPAAAAGLDRAPDDIACLIYTSGTGGRPKGVMTTHRNIMANVRGTWDLFQRLRPEERIFLSFLPLSHSYEHTVGQFLPMAIDGQIYYADGVEHLSANLVEARPGVLPCVPRLYEVLRQRISAAIDREGGIKARLFHSAVALGAKAYEKQGRLALHERVANAALDRLVRHKVHERFGGRLVAMASGGAPLNYEVGLFFVALGLPVAQGYGQTEASPVISVNPPWASKIDTVGPPLRGVEIRIAEDGEILVRGDLVMKGYWKDEEATALALRDGWLHTGDIGLMDADGYLKITDRKKDLIVNSGGDNVSPQRVEGVLALEPDIGQALVFGDRRPHLVALIVPSPTLLKETSRAAGTSAGNADPATSEAVRERIAQAVRRANTHLSSIERVRRFKIVAEPFTVENGMMTPTLKLKRTVIYKEHAKDVDALYAAPERVTAGES
jgi:long-chain acyl-CoA synthetase